MIAVLCGAAGALLVLTVLMLGVSVGWNARGRLVRPSAASEESEEERKRIREDQRAFEDMLHYNIDTAYGLNDGLNRLMGGDEG